ncbi:Site-specific DNA methylase [Mycobacteroides abscessus subsp. bolletii]|nr:Site-specific DNA methylase [Mycobacteroides abscessus subsp. bolletii]SKX37918.1 Site-specific DNA methylase [Mycobacteroides abscessus subsp. bolletii]SLF99348.1 Site-specific DNA methylase [Mycobacteroides abscessus subsp. bolletii]
MSPLRYPGAKRQLFDALRTVIDSNVPPPRLLVEPFCGGATSALRLAGTGVVDHIILADADPLVAAFWYVAAFDTTWLVNSMKEEQVTLERWDWWRFANPSSRRDRALKCLFLNRTTFSGILHGRAGPLGGRAQTSPNKINCRYGINRLERRIRAVGDLANSGHLLDVWHCDWRTSLRRSPGFGGLTPNEIVVYLDPPYVKKAPKLYEWSFDSNEHRALADVLTGSSEFRWLLSYDDVPSIRSLYSEHSHCTLRFVDYRYTAAGSTKRRSDIELLVTNYPDVPTEL